MNALRVFAFVLGLIAATCGQAGQIILNASIAPSDLLATDDTGQFHYDAYVLTTTTTTTVTVSMQAGSSLEPWMAYWNTAVLPQSDWHFANPDSPYWSYQDLVASATPGDLVSMTFTIDAGVSYQIAASTTNYLPTAAFDDYVLTVDYGTLPDGTVTLTQIPEPGTLALAAAALLGLGLRRRA